MRVLARWWPRLVKAVLYLGGGTALTLALLETWDRRDEVSTFPGWGRLLLALVLLLSAVRLISTAWLALFERHGDARLLRNRFYLSQLAKYLPGGVWQPASVIMLAPDAGVGMARASTAVGVFTVAGLISAAVVASPLGLLITEGSAAVRWLPLLGITTLPLLKRNWMERSVHRVGRIGRFDPAGVVPTQRAIVSCATAAAASLVLQGAALAILLAGVAPAASVAAAIPAFSLAWLVGFLALPVPAGMGLREAVLVAILGVSAGGRAALAAAVLHRLGAIVAEAVVVVASRRAPRMLQHSRLADREGNRGRSS